MSPSESRFESEQKWAASQQPVRAVVAYEDALSRERAMQLCRRLTRTFWNQVEFEFTWWKFNYLQDPVLASMATDEAIRADLIIVSAKGDADLPNAVKDWMDRWAGQRRKRPGSLVDLIESADNTDSQPTLGSNCLLEVAQQTGLDYFSSKIRTLMNTLCWNGDR